MRYPRCQANNLTTIGRCMRTRAWGYGVCWQHQRLNAPAQHALDTKHDAFHKEADCHKPCPLHTPTDHHMVTWQLHYRWDRGIFERICEHGIGHPDPDNMAYIRQTWGDDGTHGCDGCCWDGS